MIKNRLKHKAAGILAAFLMVGTMAGAVWADPIPEETTPPEETTVEETEPEETEPTETAPAIIAEIPEEPEDPISFGLTPDGNMSLQDDIADEEAESIEFLTVTTRDNHTFYIVIEHMKNGDNVHFLNQVDNSDLMAIMSEEEVEQYFPDGIPTESDETSETVLDENGEPVETEEDGTEAPKKESKFNLGSLKTLLIVVGVIGVFAGGYYFVKIKPKKDGKINVDAEMEDDEDYPEEEENEDEAETEESYDEEESEE
ncbi:MAG: DUF4366 domain-containing protein [Clostridiales bacterium]|nr:DUF4366 domain-containing protein [Clostridiales bacterium]